MEKNQDIIKILKKYKALKKLKGASDLAEKAYYEERLYALNTLFDRLYGHYLKEKLFYIYDELCPDDQMEDILSYLCLTDAGSGVKVTAYDFPGIQAEVNVRLFPVRIEISSLVSDYKEVLWQTE